MSAQPTISLCLCADDFAFNAPSSAAILELVRHGRLQAVSCMTQSPFWAIYGEQLKAYHDKIDIGLHLNFTQLFDDIPEQPPHNDSSYPAIALPLSQLMFKCWRRQLDPAAIEANLTLQWAQFVAVMGTEPDFIDGHQHVHQFPQIRDVLTHFLKARQFTGWVRNLSHTLPTPQHRLKTWLLPRLGAYRLRTMCEALHLRQNHSFAGVYNFEHSHSPADYARLMQSWLSLLPADQMTVLMCHPSDDSSPNLYKTIFDMNSVDTKNLDINNTAPAQVYDPIARARQFEYAYLISENFLNDCRRYAVQLRPLKHSKV